MNILQISDGVVKIPPEKVAPVETVIFNISKQLVRMGHNVTILERRLSEKDSDEEYIEGIKIIRSSTKKFRNSSGILSIFLGGLEFALKANKIIDKNKFDVIHVHLPISAIWLIYFNKKLRNKMFYTAHADEYRFNLSSRLKVPYFLRVISPDIFLINRVKMSIVLNDSLRNKLLLSKRIRSKNITTINNGVDIDRFKNTDSAIEIKNKYSTTDKIIVLFVGGITPRKGIIYLIKAAHIIVNQFNFKNIMFLMVGPKDPHEDYGLLKSNKKQSEYLLNVNELIDNLGLKSYIEFTGFISSDELKELYIISDIFVLPSLEEGFGLVLTEAMAAGKPLIGTKVGGIPDQIIDSWNGFLIDPANEKQLAEKIKYLIDNPGKMKLMSRNSRERAEKFGWENVARKYLEIYSSV